MTSYVYLLRNGDLYKIGITRNAKSLKKNLKADEIIKIIDTKYPESLQARILKRYKTKRLPGTDYFRLSQVDLEDCINKLSKDSHLPPTLSQEVIIGITASILIGIFSFIIFALLGFGIFKSLPLSILISSLPMWVLFFTGSFGGFDAIDVPIFSTWFNRIKALLIALVLLCVSYVLFLILYQSFPLNIY